MKRFELSGRFCLHNKVAILAQDKNLVQIGLCNENEKIKEKIYKVFNRRKVFENQTIIFSVIDESLWQREVSKLLSKDLINIKKSTTTKKNIETAEAPIINLLNSIIIECLLQQGSDTHIEYCKDNVRIRYRIFGYLYEQMQISVEVADALIQRIKLLSKLELAEKRRAQDGRFDFFHKNFNVDVRVSCVPSYFGESIVLRFLNRNAQLLHLKKLGFNTVQLNQIHKIKKEKNGLVLICGPTGSGKTTTLCSILNEIDKSEIKIISIEDPVEYIVDGVVQIPVNPELQMDFMDILQKIYRQDPDIIVIGEIRDELTAQTAIRSAMTGHLVFATLHTSTAVESIFRLIDMGVKNYLLAPVLQWIIIQRLVAHKGKKPQLYANIVKCNEKLKNTISKTSEYEVLDKEIQKCIVGTSV